MGGYRKSPIPEKILSGWTEKVEARCSWYDFEQQGGRRESAFRDRYGTGKTENINGGNGHTTRNGEKGG